MNNNIFCTQEGHNKDQITHLCIYEDCKLKNQQCCRLCITQGIHQHGKSDNEHIRLKQEIQIDFKDRKYNLKQIDFGDYHYEASISNDEKYLAYGRDQIFKIFDLKEDKIIKEIKSAGILKSCQFTQDSSQLFIVYSSLLIGYDVKKNFKNTFQYKNSDLYFIKIIITIQNQYLMTSEDYNNKIVKIDIKRKRKLFKLQNDRRIKGMDYDQNNNILINGSDDKSLKLWNCGNLQNIINSQQAHDDEICQIQFINNIKNVLSLDLSGNLFKWKIDLINKQLIKLEQYQSYNNIWSFQQINQNQNLLLICQDYIQILDYQGKVVIKIDHQIDHDSDDYYFRTKIRQLDNARYVIIASTKQIILASALK